MNFVQKFELTGFDFSRPHILTPVVFGIWCVSAPATLLFSFDAVEEIAVYYKLYDRCNLFCRAYMEKTS